MRGWTVLAIGIAAGLLGGCADLLPADLRSADPAPAEPTTLSDSWMVGLERMRDDALLMMPYTNRLLAALAAMPKLQVVYAGPPRNDPLFAAYSGNKLRLHPWLHGEGNCMEFTYTIFRAGQQDATHSLVVPALAAGDEPDSACVDRAASALYKALVHLGL